MPIFAGGRSVVGIYRGATSIARAYRGTTLIFGSNPSEEEIALGTAGIEDTKAKT